MGELDDSIVRLSKEDYILSPRSGDTFKSIFTEETPEAKIALMDFISTFVGKKVTKAQLMPDEPAIEGERGKAARITVQCEFDDGEDANVEIQLVPEGDNELVKSELSLCKRHAGQLLKKARDTRN